MTNVVANIWKHADQRPDAAALREGDRRWTWEELRAQVSGAAALLRDRGVAAGDRVLMVVPTSAEFVFAYHGVLALGATAVTVNPVSAPRELEYFLADAECSLAIGWDGAAEALVTAGDSAGVPRWLLAPDAIAPERVPSDIADVGGEETAVLLYTSGTTGKPKGAVLTHENLLSCGRMLSEALDTTSDDRMGTALPLFHVFGQASVMAAVFTVGASLSLLRPFSGRAMLEMAAEHRLTGLAGVPTMWNEMLHAETELTADDFADLRLACSGGAALPVEVSKAFHRRFGAWVLDGYGLSETTGAATFNSLDMPRKEGSVGRALPGCRLTILDESQEPLPVGEVGEVAIQGPVVMREYWNRPDATATVRHGSWFLTGDLGRMDSDGDLFIVDRKKDLVIRGGYNVYPREVEEVLYGHPDILEAAVIGIPDERLGEEIGVVIAPHEGRAVDAADLRAWLEQRLAAYKIPRIYQVVDALPKGSTGKILKRQIDRGDVLATGTRPSRTAPTR
ncbi:class I adenylate-forming enzyme family protein [Prauserella alba]|uniref:Long-chain fatty acid--CoA ligase n=1 Tax=Prauserella alba TaxID=176898 RepID=A0ABP4FZW7_9PSEU|nr:AMP-binding protein [Prauserella alba]MCP2182233.1 Acyl-CoA synthetase (AMP-forming)/AMP-acid ligase II [Prauserella alba]